MDINVLMVDECGAVVDVVNSSKLTSDDRSVEINKESKNENATKPSFRTFKRNKNTHTKENDFELQQQYINVDLLNIHFGTQYLVILIN